MKIHNHVLKQLGQDEYICANKPDRELTHYIRQLAHDVPCWKLTISSLVELSPMTPTLLGLHKAD
jgi:hypothetical protein